MTLTTNTQRAKQRDQGLNGRSTLGQVTQRTPRRAGQWAASLLFVALVVVGLLSLFQSQSDRVEVLVATGSVPAGQMIEQSDLRPAAVAGVPSAIPAADADTVIGQRASAGLVEGQVLTDEAVTAAVVPDEGERLVALNLPNGRVPGGLAGGDVVDVLIAPVEGAEGTTEQLQQPGVLAESARVQAVRTTPEGAVVLSVLVEDAVTNQLAAYSAAGQVTVVQAPVTTRGE